MRHIDSTASRLRSNHLIPLSVLSACVLAVGSGAAAIQGPEHSVVTEMELAAVPAGTVLTWTMLHPTSGSEGRVASELSFLLTGTAPGELTLFCLGPVTQMTTTAEGSVGMGLDIVAPPGSPSPRTTEISEVWLDGSASFIRWWMTAE